MSAVGFSNATLRLGSQATNRLRVALALAALIAINAIWHGKPIPFDAGLDRWGWLTLSGLVGLALGDAFLFACYHFLGPRLGLLLLSLAPVFGAVIAWLAFSETLTALQMAGVALTLSGIGWVVFARREATGPGQRDGRKGVIFGILAALCQAVGLVLSKQGMGGDFPPFAGTLIRMLAAAASLWLLAALQGQAGSTIRAARSSPQGLKWAIFGTFWGPVFGISASLLSIQHASVGVASTIMALPPVWMLPISHFFYHDYMTWQSVTGTLVAIGGVTLLFLQ